MQIPNAIGSIISLICISMMPESPRWLVSEGRYDDARAIFKLIGQYNGLTPEQLEEGIEKHKFDGEIEQVEPVEPV